MRVTFEITPSDVEVARACYSSHASNPFVVARLRRNVEGKRDPVSNETFWKTLTECLLTTQQRSGPESAVSRFIRTTPYPLALSTCLGQVDLEPYVTSVLTQHGGVRRAPTIAQQLAQNLGKLTSGHWSILLPLISQLDSPHSPASERSTAQRLAYELAGIGPKQSRNLLQNLGLSQYEIPIDSRVMKWMHTNLGFSLTSGALLADAQYFELVMDAFQELCRRAELLPCLLDAAIFVTFDNPGGWTDANVAW